MPTTTKKRKHPGLTVTNALHPTPHSPPTKRRGPPPPMLTPGELALGLFGTETLDSRIQPPADEKRKRSIIARAEPCRVRSLEFVFYWLCYLVAVPFMFKTVITASLPSNPNYESYEHLLSPGWLGRNVDNSDDQYSGFRDVFLFLVALMGIQLGLRRVLRFQRTQFDASFGFVVLFGLHGFGAFKVLLLLCGNYFLTKLPKTYRPKLLVWVFGVGTLFANEIFHGYSLARVSSHLDTVDLLFKGLLPRWQVFYKCTMLRLLSFSLDYLEAASDETGRPGDLAPRPIEDYSFLNYIAYAIYTPLYAAGPILSFNEYVAQSKACIRFGAPKFHGRRLWMYALRFTLMMLTMEVFLHFMYVVAMTKERAWEGQTPFTISMVAFFNLVVIWFKLTLPWRFFRLWALLDGIDPPENMLRCLVNNYSALSFWRAWHRSFNRWVIQYLYVPLGGSSRPLFNTLVVFSFVALWHDLELRLFIWGWLVVFFVVPEMVAGRLFPESKFHDKWWYRHLAAAGGAFNMWLLMIVNLAGFAVGLDGIAAILYDMVSTGPGLLCVGLTTFCLFIGAQTMFQVRAREMRRGLYLRC